MKKGFFLLATAFLVSLVYGEETETALIYGKRHFFSVGTPEGWIVDTSGASEGIPHFAYPVIYTNIRSLMPVYIYARGGDNPTGKTNNLEEFIDGDTNFFLKTYPGVIIQPRKIEFKNIRKTEYLTGRYEVLDFLYPQGEHETVVYIDAGETVVTIVYMARKKELYEKYYNDFLFVVNSFVFLGRQKPF
ncbi:hypothetical protein BREVNS_1874 [Brevinematales bacterium NS]|nr:hypothetical protein [Brevinematales bacterium]QJR22624.1 hypothetical protein BREVNS_1874 [Brevinematales bacterium NS]